MSYTLYFDLNKPATEYVAVLSVQNRYSGDLRQRAFRFNSFDELKASLTKPFCKDATIHYGGKQFNWDEYFAY